MVKNVTAFLLALLFPLVGFGLELSVPNSREDGELIQHNSVIVGEVQNVLVREGDDFSAIAERFDIGYYELFEANPGVDPDEPSANTVLIIPTQYVLPAELKPNSIVVNLAEMRLYYLSPAATKVYIFPVGIGKEDWETPLGVMTIAEKTKGPRWVVPNSILKFRASIGDKLPKVMPPGPDNPLGSYALRLSKLDYLIHGTNIAAGVGRRSSAGCIRLYEKDIAKLYRLISVGATVNIINQPYKTGWKNGRLYLEAHMPLFEQRVELGNDTKPAVDLVEAESRRQSVNVDWSKVSKIAQEHIGIPLPVDEE